MSYASGMALGLCAGKRIHQFFAAMNGSSLPIHTAVIKTEESGAFKLVHALPGRRRYRSAALCGNAKLAEAMETLLGKLTGVVSAKVNLHTGSLLCHYTCTEGQFDSAIGYLKARYFPECSAAPQSETTRQIRSFFKRVDDLIRRTTQNKFSLKSMLATFLISRGIRKVLTLRQYPSGPQMLWWAFSLLRGWTAVR